MKDYYQQITPDQEELYFKTETLERIKSSLKERILAVEQTNLAEGQGLFMLDQPVAGEDNPNEFQLAAHLIWKVDVSTKQFTHFEVIRYHLYSGSIPDELLDEINELKSRGNAEWKHDTPDQNHE